MEAYKKGDEVNPIFPDSKGMVLQQGRVVILPSAQPLEVYFFSLFFQIPKRHFSFHEGSYESLL